MNLQEEAVENIFSYGTLQIEAVQLATFNRKLEGHRDMLEEYSLTMIQIHDQNVVAATGATHHKNIQFTGASSDQVTGTIYKITKEELEQADKYEEVADYKRVRVKLKSGTDAWVYMSRHQ